jgi:hypothetical protein
VLRKIIRPTSENYNIQIPKEYINKEIEILILPFSYNKDSEKMENNFDPKKFYNNSQSSKADIDNNLNNSKSEWDSHL